MPIGVYKRTKEQIEKLTNRILEVGKKTRFKNGVVSPFKGKYHSIETKKKLSNIRKGTKHTKRTKEKMSKLRKGKRFTAEHKQKIGLANKGKLKGRKISEEHKRKISEYNRKKVLAGKHNFWKSGKSYEPYTVDWTRTLKRSIRERDNYICQLCSQYGIIVHHIDYDKKNCNPENLITLCRECHTKTNFNRNQWVKYFTHT